MEELIMSQIFPTARESRNARLAQNGPGDYAPPYDDEDSRASDRAGDMTRDLDECVRFVEEECPDEVAQLVGRMIVDCLPRFEKSEDLKERLIYALQDAMFDWALAQTEKQVQAEDDSDADDAAERHCHEERRNG